ncbi:hypothetical protein [Phytoactinopolyspora halotolerans]|uniref:MFS transporter n=1 Tax=Phytoactinopolyspora halotolerans TaxID=1981512 RepID=A0A6L9SGX5_9ACTN|nr:hypothetical protein [Phytoactinopolyspora halotolerans]NEE03858.1 hypothetical protein [Phytoactinopolyspora halotolerans]
MMGPGQGVARVARGSVLAVCCLAMSLVAHAAAGGAVHVTSGTVVGGLALSGMCIAAADARRSFGGILTVVLLSQIGLHLFAGAGGHHVESSGYGWSPGMVASHAVAAVAVSVLLAHAERLVWALWSLTRLPRVPLLGDPAPALNSLIIVRSYRPKPVACSALWLGGPGTRGPPR